MSPEFARSKRKWVWRENTPETYKHVSVELEAWTNTDWENGKPLDDIEVMKNLHMVIYNGELVKNDLL